MYLSLYISCLCTSLYISVPMYVSLVCTFLCTSRSVYFYVSLYVALCVYLSSVSMCVSLKSEISLKLFNMIASQLMTQQPMFSNHRHQQPSPIPRTLFQPC